MDDEVDDDIQSPRREKTELIAIGSEIDKLFRYEYDNK